MALSIAVVYVPSYFRIIRSQVLSIKEMPYVEAANAAGAKKEQFFHGTFCQMLFSQLLWLQR